MLLPCEGEKEKKRGGEEKVEALSPFSSTAEEGLRGYVKRRKKGKRRKTSFLPD